MTTSFWRSMSSMNWASSSLRRCSKRPICWKPLMPPPFCVISWRKACTLALRSTFMRSSCWFIETSCFFSLSAALSASANASLAASSALVRMSRRTWSRYGGMAAAAYTGPQGRGAPSSGPAPTSLGGVGEHVHQALHRLLEGRVLVGVLLEEVDDRVVLVDGVVGARVGAVLVGADQDQVALLLVGRERLAELAAGLLVLLRDDLA